jgi:hypothetical protein
MIDNTVTTIEEDLKKNLDILLNNFNTFQQKYRGDEDMDVILYTEYNEVINKTFIKLYVADLNTRLFNTYTIEKRKLKKVNTFKKDGHKRIHYKYR